MTEYISDYLQFDRYMISNFVFKNNNDFIPDREQIELEFDFGADIAITQDKKNAKITLRCEIFNEDLFNGNKAPFYLSAEVDGFFSCNPTIDINDFEINSIAILLPYLRAFITSFTAQAGIPAVIIPPIDVYNLVRQKDEE